MLRKGFSIMIIALWVGFALLLASGCAKKTVKQDPSIKSIEELAAERERTARVEAEQKEREARERELARLKEEEAKKREQERQEFEQSLVAKRTPGIEGEIYESKLLKRIHFEFDKYEIRPSDAEILKENAAVLTKFPRVKIQIEGHCDERGTNEYNLALAERRANNTRQYLLSLGVEVGRISIISYGEEKPLDPDHDEEAWSKNRRADFIIVSK